MVKKMFIVIGVYVSIVLALKLVLGCNDIFITYISPILPSLFTNQFHPLLVSLFDKTKKQIDKADEKLNKAKSEPDPSKKLEEVKKVLNDIENIKPKDIKHAIDVLNRLSIVKGIALEVEMLPNTVLIGIQAKSCRDLAEQIGARIKDNFKNELKNEEVKTIAKAHKEIEPKKAIDLLTEFLGYYPTAKTYNERGVFKNIIGDYKGAIEDFNESIRLNPKDSIVFNNRGNSKSELEDYEGAISDYDQSIRLNPTDSMVYINRGNSKIKIGDHKGAIKDFGKSIRLNPQNSIAYNNRGLLKKYLGDHEGAIADFNESIRLNPKDAIAYNNRGNSKNELGDYNGAIKDYDESIKLNPGDAIVYNNRGNSKSDLGDPHGAIEDYNLSIRLNPDDASVYNNRGNLRSDLDDITGAIEDFNEAITLSPNDFSLYANRGQAKMREGNLVGAIEDFDFAIRLNPNDDISYYNRGVAKYIHGDFKKAIDDFDRALRFNPHDGIAYYNRGDAKYELDDLSGAIKDYSDAIKLSPQFAEPYQQRSVTYRKLAQRESDFKKRAVLIANAQKDEEKAKVLIQIKAQELFEIGCTRFNQKNYTYAIKIFDEVIQLNPNFAEAYYYRGCTKEKLIAPYSTDAITELKEVLDDCSKAILLKPDYFDASIKQIDIRRKIAKIQSDNPILNFRAGKDEGTSNSIPQKTINKAPKSNKASKSVLQKLEEEYGYGKVFYPFLKEPNEPSQYIKNGMTSEYTTFKATNNLENGETKNKQQEE